MNLKHLFCKHIWKTESHEYLRTERESWGLLSGRITTYANFRYYAELQICIRCDKKRTVERKYTDREG